MRSYFAHICAITKKFAAFAYICRNYSLENWRDF